VGRCRFGPGPSELCAWGAVGGPGVARRRTWTLYSTHMMEKSVHVWVKQGRLGAGGGAAAPGGRRRRAGGEARA